MTYSLNPNIGAYVNFMRNTLTPNVFDDELRDVEVELQNSMKENGFKDLNQVLKAIAIDCNEYVFR